MLTESSFAPPARLCHAPLMKPLALRDTARRSLEKNLTETSHGVFLRAGAHQFASFWTRDFCFAVPGLLRLNHAAVARAQIDFLLQHRRADGLVPRGFDSVNPKRRVIRHTLLRRWSKPEPAVDRRPLKAEYMGEHNTPCFDSNALLLWAAATTALKGGSVDWFRERASFWHQLVEFYDPHRRNGLIHQPPYSDWQDSTRREGPGFYVNLVFWRALLAARQAGVPLLSVPQEKNLEEKIFHFFFDPLEELFVQDRRFRQVPLECHLWVLGENLFTDFISGEKLYQKLRSHPLWNPGGIPVYPPSKPDQVSWTTKIVGLRHYHDGLVWSWLLAEQARTAHRFGDTAARNHLLLVAEDSARKQGWIGEVDRPFGDHLIPFESSLYRSESPFSWGAATWVDVLAEIGP
ncbi:MAG: hypothetical protein KF802_05390 [Bdellovibrionaceae bacterium]|nr:hypothetical protein [Pseudobdellovibrionaceae bacterium]MBX3032343.1 hypothetical protein [Pseudobdellovibrionaceae bacterium]